MADRSDRSRTSDIDRLSEVINNLQKSLQCTICLELMTEPTKTRCGHSFCKSCIGRVLQRKSASCPLCKKSLNRRNISKDDDLQTYIEKFDRLVIAIQTDTHVDILSHSKQPCNTRESHAGAFFGDDEIDVKPDIKIRTWLRSFPDKLNTDDLSEVSIEDKAGPMNPISDSGKSDEIGEVQRDGIDASRRPSHDRKRSTDCPESINKDTLSQVNKGARQTDEVIEIDSNASELKYNATHARIRAKESHEKNVRTKSNIEKTINQDISSSSHKTAYDQIHQVSAPSCLSTSTSAITEQSSANWSRMMEFGKEMKRARKRKVRKLDVSTKKNMNPPRIVENITLSPNSRYDTIRIAGYNKNEKEANVSNRSKSNDQKQDTIDESLDLSDAKSLSETDTRELFDKGKADCSKSTYPTMNTSYITLEEGRQIGIINVNNGVNKIVDKSIAEDQPQNQHREENTADYRDSSLSQQKGLTLLTPEKPNESVHEREIIRNVSQTSADNFGSSFCLPAEKRTPGSRETNNVQEISNEATSSQFQSSTPNKTRLSLKRKSGIDKCIDSPPLSELPLSRRFSIGKHEEYIARKIVDSPVSKDDELFDRLKVVKRDLNFKIREDQQRTNRDTVRANVLKNIIEVEDNDRNVSEIVRKDRKLGRNFTVDSTVSKKSLSIKPKSVENQRSLRRSLVKFTQSGSLIRRLNVKYFFLGTTKRELSMPAEVQVTPVYNMQQSVSRSEVQVAISPQPWNDTQNSSNITVVENISFASDSNSNEVISKEFPATSTICRASPTPKKDIESRLNQKKSTMIVQSSTNANQRSDKSIENVTEKSAQSPHKTSRPDKNTIHRTISRTHPGTSNSIKLLSPDKDSQLKFLKIDSPMSEREESRRANLIKLVNERNNFSEMKNSRLAASTPDKAQEPFIKNLYKKRKRIRCANDKELFDDESSDGSDDSNDLISDSSRTTIIRVRCSELSKKAGSSRLDANKKRRLSSSDDQDIEVISVSKKQDAPERKFKTSSSDTESESATHATKNLKRHSDQYAQRNASITDTATKKCSTRQDSENLRIQNIIDKWSNEHITTQKKLTKESKNTQNSVKSMRNSSEENPASHQSSRSSNTLKMEKHKNVKPSQKSSARESDMFESNSLFTSENLDYILQQSTKLNVDNTSTKKVDSSNDDIINRVLQIDRSRGNADACQPPDSAPRNDLTSQKEKDSREYLLQDNFDEIIACVEQPQSEDFISCSEQSDRNSNRPLAKQKTSNCLAMTDEPCNVMQETPIVPPSSTNDMFEHYSPRNVKKLPAMNVISSNSDKENVACSQKRRDYVSDQKDKKDAATNADAIDKDSRKKIISKHNVSREKEKLLEERNNSIRSAGRLHADDNETQKTTAGNESNSKDDTFEHDSFMNITQHQVQLQMFEEDLFGIAARNQMKTKILQKDLSQREQHTPRKRKQNSQDKNTEPGERSADEDDIVENTPEKKMKNNGNNVKTNESRESTKIAFLSPISKTTERTPSPHQMIRSILRSDASTPMNLFSMCPSSQSTPIIAHNSTINNRSGILGGSKRTERIESGSILLTKQDAKTLENVRRLPDKRDLRFVCSGLSASQITTVKEFAAKYNASYANQFDRDVTHVIVKTIGEQNAAKSTLKYLQGIAHRKWIVSYRWIEDCNRQQELLDELPYEATTQNDVGTNGAGPRNSRLRDKGLFEGFTFLCVEPYDNVTLEQYQDLLLATGAAVVNSFEVFAKKGGIKGVVIQDNVHDDKIIERWYRTLKAAPILVDWIVECIGHYKLFKLAPYIQCLSPQDFCAIGYPRELVEEDEEYSDDE